MPTGIEVTERGSLLLIALTPATAPTDAAEAWLVDAVAELIAAVRARLATAAAVRPRLALVLHGARGRDAEERALADALAAATRGIAQSLALELAPATCVNAIVCDEPADAESAIALLAGADGGFVTGTTIDLRAAA